MLTAGSVQVRGEAVYYQASGSPERGPTVLFLHESGGCSDTWERQLSGLARVARCLGLDLPGHGWSEGSGYSSVSAYRQAVLGFLDALAIRWPVVLVGVSLGAAIAVDLALHAPERVAGVAVAGVCQGGRACAETLGAVQRGEAPSEFVRRLFGANPSPQLMQKRLRRWYLTGPRVRLHDLTAVADYDLTAALLHVSHPVLVMAGSEDPIATPEVAEALSRECPNLRYETIPGAGCLAMVEQPGTFNRALAAFLDDLNPICSIDLKMESVGGYRRYLV